MSYNPPGPNWGQQQGAQPQGWGTQPPQDNQFANQQANVPFASQYGGFRPQYQEQSQAGLALGLGIGALLSLFLCAIIMPFLGGAAWFFGQKEKKAIQAGLRDPSGAGQAQAGMVMGIIALVLFFLFVIGYILLFVVLAASA